MATKSFVSGTMVGGCTVFITGVLLFAVPPVSDFYRHALNAGSATGVARDWPLVWAVLVGALGYGALVTLAIGRGSGHQSILAGIRTGAVVGCLLWLTANFMLFGVTNVGSLATAILDSLLELVPGAAAGGVVAAVLGRAGATRAAHAAHA